ncbi:Oxygen sensor histidine kinase NreB [Flavobacterium sp. TAB 87]|nr:Oxygen sensor histidine kinase NreB [Flavobacterium sp. TAB 87]
MLQVSAKLSLIPEKDIVLIILFSSVFFMLVAAAIVVFFYFSRKKINQKEMEKKNIIIEYQDQQLKAVILTQETERKRIAQDLHDDISSKLNVVKLNCHLLSTPNLSPAEQKEITSIIIDLTNKALDSSRKIAHNLLPPVLEKFGLDAGIKELCLEFESSRSVKIEYNNVVDFDFKNLHNDLHVFRILQELLNNSVRHGQATFISITLRENDNFYSCIYTDNGIGFDTNLSSNQKGLGTKNIESRVRFLNGTLEIKSARGEGTRVNFTF